MDVTDYVRPGEHRMNSHRFSHSALVAVVIAALLGLGFGPTHGAQPKSRLTASQAEAVALKKYKTGKLQGKTELEYENRKWQYAVMVKAGGKLHEVMVNAKSGKIDSEEIVTVIGEAAEKKTAAAKIHKKITK